LIWGDKPCACLPRLRWHGWKEVAMTIVTLILTMLIVGFAIGLTMGFIILCNDRHRKRSSKTLNLKDGITLEYDCTHPGIYEKIKGIF